MKHGLSNEEAIQAIKSNYPPERYTVLREALDMAMDALQELTEKDANIKELQEERDNTAKASWGVVTENVRLRKALEEAREEILEGKPFEAIDVIEAALGEGDKE